MLLLLFVGSGEGRREEDLEGIGVGGVCMFSGGRVVLNMRLYCCFSGLVFFLLFLS